MKMCKVMNTEKNPGGQNAPKLRWKNQANNAAPHQATPKNKEK